MNRESPDHGNSEAKTDKHRPTSLWAKLEHEHDN